MQDQNNQHQHCLAYTIIFNEFTKAILNTTIVDITEGKKKYWHISWTTLGIT